MALFSIRYARAFAEAVDNAKLDTAETESHLESFAAALAGSPDLREAMESPAIRMDEKLNVLDAVLGKIGVHKKDKLVRDFLAVLIGHDRIAFLPEVLDEYRAIVDAENGVVRAKVTSAQPLSEEARALVEKQILSLAGSCASKTVNAEYSEDSSLLGGVVVRLGSTIYDGSVQGRLKRLKVELAQG